MLPPAPASTTNKAKRNRANSRFEGHNGRREAIKPVVRAVKCKKQRKHAKHGHAKKKRGGRGKRR